MMLLCHLIPTVSRENDNFAPFQKEKKSTNYLAVQPYVLYYYYFSCIKKKIQAPLVLDSCLSITANMDNIQKQTKSKNLK